MKRMLTLSVLLVVGASAQAQMRDVVLTRPTAPPRDVLDRLGLTLAWKTRLKLPETPDTLRSVQLLTAGADLQIAVQSQSGTIYLLDAQTGDLLWSAPVGTVYWESQPVAANARNIFVTRKQILYVLDRKNGRQRVYSFDNIRVGAKTVTNRIHMGFNLPSAPSAPLIATEKILYVPIGDRVVAYEIPAFDAAELFAMEEYGGLFKVPSVQPERIWSQRFGETFFSQEPLIAGSQIALVTDRGLLSLGRFNGVFLYRFNATGRVVAPVGQHEGHAYVGSDDSTLYAVNLESGRLSWRYLAPGAILSMPHVTDDHVFLFPDRKGLTLVDRKSGTDLWRHDTAANFLALGDRFVYATDNVGKLLVLDRRRGTALGQFALNEWRIPVANEYTDRIYFANHDGQLMCMYPKGSVPPLSTKVRPGAEAKDPDAKELPKLKDKDADKEKDKEKEKDKDADKEKEKEKVKDADKEKAKEDKKALKGAAALRRERP